MKRIFVSQTTLKMGRNRSHRILERLIDKGKETDAPNLEFIKKGTESITIPNNKLTEFCPHIYYCPAQSIDKNCFYNKFLHCQIARQLEKKYPLKQIDKFYLRYKDRLKP